MYQALYRKYRPCVFDDVVGQEHITTTLKGSLKNNKIFHAYLFTGTRGTGKTTCAKILAKAVCCLNLKDGEPCGECEACKAINEGKITDILEIDAASNNGVNDIRDLKEQVNFLPVNLKYRVYIIDEVHMLSLPAFNALLKTLEEPPAHVIFILATTEVHKLPATILSRCQRFDFKRLEPETIVKRMNVVAEMEGFKITDGAGIMIASLADGGMRDALSILDQCSSCSSEIDENVIADVCGIAGNQKIASLINAIKSSSPETAIQIIDELYRNSVDMKKLLFEMISCFRNLMIIKTVKEPRELIICSSEEYATLKGLAEDFSLSRIVDCLSSLQTTNETLSTSAARSEVELVVVKLCSPALAPNISGLAKRIELLENTVEKLSSGATISSAKVSVPIKVENEKNAQPEKDIAEPKVLSSTPSINEQTANKTASPLTESEQPQEPKAAINTTTDEPIPVTEWPEILAIVKKNCPIMGGFLAGSRAFIGGNRLLIDSKLAQFKEMLNSDVKYRDYIRSAAQEVLGVSYNLGPYNPKSSEKKAATEDPLAAFAKSLNEQK